MKNKRKQTLRRHAAADRSSHVVSFLWGGHLGLGPHQPLSSRHFDLWRPEAVRTGRRRRRALIGRRRGSAFSLWSSSARGVPGAFHTLQQIQRPRLVTEGELKKKPAAIKTDIYDIKKTPGAFESLNGHNVLETEKRMHDRESLLQEADVV